MGRFSGCQKRPLHLSQISGASKMASKGLFSGQLSQVGSVTCYKYALLQLPIDLCFRHIFKKKSFVLYVMPVYSTQILTSFLKNALFRQNFFYQGRVGKNKPSPPTELVH